jgi:hypothetical protein
LNSNPDRIKRLGLRLLIVAWLAAHFAAVLPAAGAAANDKGAPPLPRAGGKICIAPFHPARFASEPPMLMDHPAPGPDSKYSFRVDGKLKASVGVGELGLIAGVPVDRKVRVQVLLDGKPIESFKVDLRRARGHRDCLWLHEGYWTWSLLGDWYEESGCRCASLVE